jgi:F0F1-type ATP synthase epsilon subunit
MEMKERLMQTLVNLRSMEIKGQNNVMILAQTFLDLEAIIKQMDESEKALAEATVEEKKEDKAEKKADKK